MRNPLYEVVENRYKRTTDLDLHIGDTVVVTTRIIEGEKERLQDFEGTIVSRKGSGLNGMFTVRKIVGNEGVERIFPIHSPKVVSIKSIRSGRIRRAKLYYLRDRVGKARKLRERRVSAEARKAAAAARSDKARALAEAQDAVLASRRAELAGAT